MKSLLLNTQPAFAFTRLGVDNGEGVEGGWGVKCERVETMFNQEFTPIGPRLNLILFNPLHCYKNSFTLLEITICQDKIYGWSAQDRSPGLKD